MQAQVLAAALNKGLRRSPSDKKCFSCGQARHFKRECPSKGGTRSVNNTERIPAAKCPRCQKGYHWARDCRSKFDFQGQPLSGNGPRAQPRGPENVYGALTNPIKFVPQSNNPFQLQTSTEAPQGVQDWTSAPLPEQY